MCYRNYTAEAVINPYRFAKFGVNDGDVMQASAVTDKIIGVFTEVGAEAGERIDVQKEGSAKIQAGGNITKGSYLTADANGKAIVASLTAAFALIVP